jgi:hypothetical protein
MMMMTTMMEAEIKKQLNTRVISFLQSRDERDMSHGGSLSTRALFFPFLPVVGMCVALEQPPRPWLLSPRVYFLFRFFFSIVF